MGKIIYTFILLFICFSELLLPQNKMLVPYRVGDFWTYADTTGTIIIKDRYKNAEPFHDGVAKVIFETKDGLRRGFINSEGTVITSVPEGDFDARLEDHNEGIVSSKLFMVPTKFFNSKGERIFEDINSLGKFNNGLAPATFWLKEMAYVDINGNKVIKFPKGYISALSDFDGEFAKVDLDKLLPGFQEVYPGKVTVIDRKGRFPIKKTFAGISYSEDGIFQYSWIDEGGFLTREGKPLFKYTGYITRIENFHHGKALIKTSSGYGFVNRLGKIVIPAQYQKALEFDEDITFVKSDNEWKLIDIKNRQINNSIYKDVKAFSEGLAAVEDSAWYFINKAGKRVFEQSFSNVESFKDGMAAVMLDGKWGFIDKSGQLVIKNKYDSVKSFSNGIAQVSPISGLYFYIDKKGREYWSKAGSL